MNIPHLTVEIGPRMTFKKGEETSERLALRRCCVMRFSQEAEPMPGPRSKKKGFGPFELSPDNAAGLSEQQIIVNTLRHAADILEKGRFISVDNKVKGTLLEIMGHELDLGI